MNVNGDIIIIEDDEDDRDFFRIIYDDLPFTNKLVFFKDAFTALEYLKSPIVQPFLIISDINMPKVTGFELRNLIFSDSKLAELCVPYIFMTTASSPAIVKEAYSMSIQGFFKKESDYAKQKEIMQRIILYWKESYTP